MVERNKMNKNIIGLKMYSFIVNQKEIKIKNIHLTKT